MKALTRNAPIQVARSAKAQSEARCEALQDRADSVARELSTVLCLPRGWLIEAGTQLALSPSPSQKMHLLWQKAIQVGILKGRQMQR